MRLALARTGALARHQVRLLSREWTLPLLYIAIPIIVCTFVRRTYGEVLKVGFPGATGDEIAVPGQAIVAAFLVLALLGWSMFLDHRWGTWPRLRSSACRPSEIVIARLSVAGAHLFVQFAAVFTISAVVFNLSPSRGWGAVAAVTGATVAMVLAYGAMAMSFSRSNPMFDAFVTIGALVLCGLGGAITPEELLPGWASAIAPYTPVTWAMRGFRACFLSGVDSSIDRSIIVLLGFTGAFAAVAALRYRPDEPRAASTRG